MMMSREAFAVRLCTLSPTFLLERLLGLRATYTVLQISRAVGTALLSLNCAPGEWPSAMGIACLLAHTAQEPVENCTGRASVCAGYLFDHNTRRSVTIMSSPLGQYPVE